MKYFLSQKHRHLEAGKQVYKLVLEPEIKSKLSPCRCLQPFWSHCRDRSGNIVVHKAAAGGLPSGVPGCWSSGLLPEFMPVSCCSGAELWSDAQECLAGCTAVTLHLMYLQLVWVLLWAGDGSGFGGTAMPGSADHWWHRDGKRQQGWQDNFPSRLKWLFLNGAIHDYNSSYVCIVLKHTFLLWAQHWSPLKLWEVHMYHSGTVFVQCTLPGRDNLLYSSASLFRIEEVTSPDVHLGLVTFGLTDVDSWTEPGFLRAGWECSALW